MKEMDWWPWSCHSFTRDAKTYGHMHIFCLVIHLIEMQKLMETSIFSVVSFTYYRCTNLRTHPYFLLCHSLIGEAQTYGHIHIFCCGIHLLEMQKLMDTSIFCCVIHLLEMQKLMDTFIFSVEGNGQFDPI